VSLGKASKIGFIIAVVVGVIIFLAGAAYYLQQTDLAGLQSLSDEEIKSMTVSWDYKDILRNPQKYEGKIIHFTAEVWKVQQKFGDNYWLEVQTDETCRPVAWDCGNFVIDYTGSRILKNDIVEVYAQVDYVNNYTILGSVIPVPYVTEVRLGCVSC